jgi:hypothetical protein
VPAAFLALALVGLFYPMLASGLEKVPGDPGDARLVIYILEHSFLWITGNPNHASFWDPPVFFPSRNVAAYTETLLGAAPLYWIWRAARIAPDTAFELWLLTVVILDFWSAYTFLRRIVGVSEIAAGMGALLFCADAARIRVINHAQLMPQFYSFWALYALARLAGDPEPRRPWLWWLAAAGAVVAQLWASYYLAWFMALGLVVFALWGLAFAASRRALLRVARRDWRWAVLAALLAAAAVWPLAAHARLAVADLGWRPLAESLGFLPDATAWLSQGEWSRLFHGTRFGAGGEVAASAGWLTTALALAGLWLTRGRTWSLPALAASLTLAALVTRFPGGLTPWSLLYQWVPGAGAIRAVSRVTLVLLIPWLAGLACALDRWRRPLVAAVVAAALALCCLVEQVYLPVTYSKAAARLRARNVADRIPAGCRAFLALSVGRSAGELSSSASIIADLDAMSAQLIVGIPTCNGYGLQAVVSPEGEPQLVAKMRSDLAAQGLRPADVCLVEIVASPLSPPPPAATGPAAGPVR